MSVSFELVMDKMKSAWNQQNKYSKYLAIAGISIASCSLGRHLYWMMYRKYDCLPPGPIGYPLLGVLWNLNSEQNIKRAKQYGPIQYMNVLGEAVIILNSSKLVKQLFIKKDFLNRAIVFDKENDYYHCMTSTGQSEALSFLSINGNPWKKRRKLCRDTLFKILDNKHTSNLLQKTFNNEFKPYLNEIISTKKAWYPRNIMEYITLNTIYSTIFGKKLERDSKLFLELQEDINSFFKLGVTDYMVTKLPFLKYIYGQKLDKIRDRRDETLLRLIKERANIVNKKEKLFIDFTHKMVQNGELSQDEEIADTFILFAAAMDTTSSTLDFAVALLAKYENIQEKIRNELIDIMGTKEFNLKIVNKCGVFRAAIHEIMRISSVAPMGQERISFSDEWITSDDGKKYKIPKNTIVMPNSEYIHIGGDKNEHWKRINGDEIILENFLIDDKDGLRFVVNKSFIPFGVGQRDCVGRSLAMKEIQYTLGYLLMNYKVSLMNKDDKNVNISLRKGYTVDTCFLDPPIPIKIETISW
eukprot:315402_1